MIFAPIRSSLSLEIQSIPSPGGRGSLFTRGACLIFYIHVWPMRWAPFWGRLVIRPRVYSRKYSNCLKCGNVNIKVLYTVHDTSMKLQTIIELKQAALDTVHVTNFVQSDHCRWRTDSFTFVRVVSAISFDFRRLSSDLR